MQVKEPSVVMINGRKMAYDEVSPPNPKGTILLLTGLGSKRLGWYKQLEVLGEQYRTIALDHRDTGDSDYVSEPYTTDDQADDAATVLRALGINKATVMGISMGGFITLHLVLRHPELVERIVLIGTSAGGTTHVPPSQEMMAMLMNRATDIEIGEMAIANYTRIMGPGYIASHPTEANMVAEIARYKPQKPDGYMRQLQSAMSHAVSERLTEIKVPTLVIHGDSDPLVPTPNGIYLAEHIPGAKLILMPGVGHIPIIERGDEFNQAVLDFIAEN